MKKDSNWKYKNINLSLFPDCCFTCCRCEKLQYEIICVPGKSSLGIKTVDENGICNRFKRNKTYFVQISKKEKNK